MRKFIFGMICAMFLSMGVMSCSNGATTTEDTTPTDSIELVDSVVADTLVEVADTVVAE